MFEPRQTKVLALAIAHEIMEGATWQEARDRIAYQVGHHNHWPTAEQIESCLRSELYLLEPDHAEILASWRSLALYTMQRIDFPTFLTGSVLNGCATIYSNLRLAAYTDDIKSVEIALMQADIPFEVVDAETTEPMPLVAYGWLWNTPSRSIFRQKDPFLQRVGIRLEVFKSSDFARNPYKKSPDCHQEPWEAGGRISFKEFNTVFNTSREVF